jgi:hypothetical protein
MTAERSTCTPAPRARAAATPATTRHGEGSRGRGGCRERLGERVAACDEDAQSARGDVIIDAPHGAFH